MRNAVLIAAALMFAAPVAYAGEAAKPAADKACTAQSQGIDCGATGSVTQDAGRDDKAGPRLGYEGDPWFVVSSF